MITCTHDNDELMNRKIYLQMSSRRLNAELGYKDSKPICVINEIFSTESLSLAFYQTSSLSGSCLELLSDKHVHTKKGSF